MSNKNLPAGLIDGNLELFAVGKKVKAIYKGEVISFGDLPEEIKEAFRTEIVKDKEALLSLSAMGHTTDKDMLLQYVFCNYGGFDNEADFKKGVGKKEYWDCGRRGKCNFEGKLCKNITINGKPLTPREIQVIKLIASGYLDKEISGLLFISISTVATHKDNIYKKTGTTTKVELAVLATKLNLI